VVLERLLAGLSPAAKRGVTVALIAIAWVGFLTAVLAGLVAGVAIILVGFVACWLVVASLSGRKKEADDREDEPLLREADVEPDDVQSRVQRRLQSMAEGDRTAPPEEPAT
jgi:hypothetical protein